MYVWWGRSKKKERGVRGWWGKKRTKKKKEMRRCGMWVVKKKGGGRIYNENRGRGKRKIGKGCILGVVKKINK
jgi:hypothetical protein